MTALWDHNFSVINCVNTFSVLVEYPFDHLFGTLRFRCFFGEDVTPTLGIGSIGSTLVVRELIEL